LWSKKVEDNEMLEVVLLTCIEAKEFGVLIKLIDALPKLTTGSFVPTAFMMTQYVYACYKLKESDKAIEALQLMTRHKYAPSMVSVSQAISLSESRHDFDKSIEIFESYVARHLLPTENDSALIVDLHGYSQIIARVAIRSALNVIEADKNNGQKRTLSLIIITGIGKNSKELLEPVLKPSIKVFLQSLDPPLLAAELMDNPGRLIVSGGIIDTWITHRKRESEGREKSWNTFV
jgi:DNA-nicking Smr family endonuclease